MRETPPASIQGRLQGQGTNTLGESARKHGSHVGLGVCSRRLSWAALLVVPFILSVLSPTLIGAVQRRKQFQCATLAVSTGEVPAGTSAHRNIRMLRAGRCGSEDFSFFLPAPPRGWRARSLGIRSGTGFDILRVLRRARWNPSSVGLRSAEPRGGSSTEIFCPPCPPCVRTSSVSSPAGVGTRLTRSPGFGFRRWSTANIL